MRKIISIGLVSIFMMLVNFSSANAKEYPSKTVKMIIPYKPGGDTDLTARVLAKNIKKELGKNVVIVNMAGAGGSIASRHVKDAKPDGYTVLYWHPSFLLNNIVGVTDFDHNAFEIVAIPAFADAGVWVTNSESDFDTLPDLINEIKQNPGKVKYAATVGNYSHIQSVAVEQATGGKFNNVDAGGAADKIAAVLGGHLEVFTAQYGLIKDYVDSGEMKVLGALAPERSAFIPNVPTFKEQGVDVAFEKFYFIAMPKGTPKKIVDTFAKAVQRTLDDPKVQKEYKDMYVQPKFIGGQDAYDYIDGQAKYYNSFKSAIFKDK